MAPNSEEFTKRHFTRTFAMAAESADRGEKIEAHADA
jgi:hypothetical protein